jgi:hypothetical protein
VQDDFLKLATTRFNSAITLGGSFTGTVRRSASSSYWMEVFLGGIVAAFANDKLFDDGWLEVLILL